MSNLPKFRAWHKGSKNEYNETQPEMFYSSTKNNVFLLNSDGSWELGEAGYEWEIKGASSMNGDVLMQSTGFFDNQEKEIFIKDVVEIIHPCWRNKAIVQILDGSIIFISIDSDNLGACKSYRDIILEGLKLKIIGNILENPSLHKF